MTFAGFGRKRIIGVCRAKGTCLVPANVVIPGWGGAKNSLAGFEGPLRGGEKRGEREGRERKGKDVSDGLPNKWLPP